MSTSDQNSATSIPIQKLAIVNRLGTVGVDGIEQRLDRLGEAVTVESEQVKVGFVNDEILGTIDGDFTSDRVGTRSQLPGAPYGYTLVLFGRDSANRAAALMLAEAVDDLTTVDREMAQSALTELGGIMASGFLDSWADAFDQQIDIDAPTPVGGPATEIVRSMTADQDDLGLFIASKLRLPKQGVRAEVYLFPEHQTFLEILRRIDPSALADS